MLTLVFFLALQAAPPKPAPKTSTPRQRSAPAQPQRAAQNTIQPAPPPVVIREPVIVHEPARKDWWDRAYVVFSGLLVIIGAFGVIAALRTLRAIKRQADIMDSQKGILAQSVKAAEDNAKAASDGAEAANKNVEMFISKERARLRIDLKPLDLKLKYDSTYAVDFALNIHGTTAAYIVDHRCTAYLAPWEIVGEPEAATALMFPIYSLPNVIAPNTPPLEQYAFLHVDGTEDLSEIKESRQFVGVRGFIKYKDVFDRERETRFRYVWKYSLYGGGVSGNWEKSGSEEDNLET
jgi:hypothetical protein